MKIALLMLLFAVSASSQSVTYKNAPPCELELKDAPTIRGLKLGMTRQEVYKVFPNGVRFLVLTDLKNRPEFEGVKAIEYDFYDERLSSFEISYIKTASWDSAQEFVFSIAPALHLPVEPWTYSSRKGRLECPAFTVEVDPIYQTILMTDVASLSSAERQRLTEERAKKRAFKP